MSGKTRIALSTLEGIRKTDGGLFHALLDKAAKAEPGGKVVVVDSADIKGESFKLAWTRWVDRNPSLILSKDEQQDTLWQVEQEQAARDARKAEVEAQSKATLEVYFEGLPQEQFIAWRKAKRVVASGVTEMPGDVTVGRNLPQAPTRTVANNIGGSLPL